MNVYHRYIMVWSVCIVVFCALAGLVVVAKAAPEGGNYIVTRLDDPPAGACSPGDCSLREALNAAGGGSGLVITFAVTGTVELTQSGLFIYGTTLLQGSGAEHIVIDANGLGEVFSVVENAPNPAPLCSPTISGVTITGGASTGIGGGVAVESDCSVTITDSVVRNNSATNQGGGVAGGGSDPRGITIRNSAIISNTAPEGAGIFLQGNGLLENVTISGNTATNTGGGLLVAPFEPASGTYTTTLRSVTVAENSALVGDGVVLMEFNPPQNTNVYLHNSIISGTSACATVGFNTLVLTSNGYNLATDESCNLTHPMDLATTNPQLPSLREENGTFLHVPVLTSPALDSGASGTLTTDQRGLTRPVDLPGLPNTADGADRGAYEHQAIPPTSVTLGTFVAHTGNTVWLSLLVGVALFAAVGVVIQRRP